MHRTNSIYIGGLLKWKSTLQADYLADVNEQAEEMLFRLVKQMAEKDGVTEERKRQDQVAWVGA